MDILSIPGVRFSPDRVDLIKFLYIMANGGRLAPYIPIKEYIDVYEDDKIWELMEEKEELYCFMKLKNKTSKSSRINRVTQRGTWKGQSDEEILNGQDHVGSCRSFSFVQKNGVRKENRMVMHEYRLDGIFKTLHSGYVIVHIKRYPGKDVKVNQHKDEENRDEQALIPIQPSQPPQNQQQDEQGPLQRFALEMDPFLADTEWKELGLPEDGDIGYIDPFLNTYVLSDIDALIDEYFKPLPLPLEEG